MRKKVVGIFEEWVSALSAIIEGIDAGVFIDENDIREAKQNLLGKYKSPFFEALLFLRADRALTWTAFTRERIDEARTPDPLWQTVTECLELGEERLMGYLEVLTLLDSRTLNSRHTEEFAVILTHLQGCLAQVKTLPHEDSKPATP